MPDQSYRTFLKNLEQQGHLLRFTKEVDPLANLSAIEWRVYNEMGRSSLFTNVRGHPDWQVASQILADRAKWSIALGVDEDDLLDWLVERTDNPVDMVEVSTADAPLQEMVTQGDNVNLDDVPTVITSENDGGRYLASGMAVIRDPETGQFNVSIHRQQIFDRNTTGMIMVPRHARAIYDKYCAQNEPMPIAFFYGVHPAIFFSASVTTRMGLNELTIAGSLLGEGVRTVKCRTNDLVVPAEAEMVLEGVVMPNETRPEGPFGEIVGTYADAGESEVFHVNAMTRRADLIHYGIHCGFPVTDTQGVMCLGLEAATKTHLHTGRGRHEPDGCALPRRLRHDGFGPQGQTAGGGVGEYSADGGALRSLSAPEAGDRRGRGYRCRRPAPGDVVADHSGACGAGCGDDPEHPHLRPRQGLGRVYLPPIFGPRP